MMSHFEHLNVVQFTRPVPQQSSLSLHLEIAREQYANASALRQHRDTGVVGR